MGAICVQTAMRDVKTSNVRTLLRGLVRLRAPMVILTLVSLLFGLPGVSLTHYLGHLEMFAGMQAVTNYQLEMGRVAEAFEITKGGEVQDIMSNVGYANALYLTANLNPNDGAGKLTAPVCSTWVYMSRFTTKRSSDDPLGRCLLECKHQHVKSLLINVL